jgi:hypothetical protein
MAAVGSGTCFVAKAPRTPGGSHQPLPFSLVYYRRPPFSHPLDKCSSTEYIACTYVCTYRFDRVQIGFEVIRAVGLSQNYLFCALFYSLNLVVLQIGPIMESLRLCHGAIQPTYSISTFSSFHHHVNSWSGQMRILVCICFIPTVIDPPRSINK